MAFLLALLFVFPAFGAPADDSAFRAEAVKHNKAKELYDAWALNPVNGLTRSGVYFLETQSKLIRLSSAFAAVAGPIGVAWVFVNELADAQPAYGSLGDPYRSREGIFRFAHLPREEQARILRLDDAFSRWYSERQAELERELPALSAIICDGSKLTALAGGNVLLTVARDENGVFELVKAEDKPSHLAAEYDFEEGQIQRVRAAAKEKGQERPLELSQYENFLKRGNWAYGREAHRRMRAALVGALFRADELKRRCPIPLP
jgi:hypothetical protein